MPVVVVVVVVFETVFFCLYVSSVVYSSDVFKYMKSKKPLLWRLQASNARSGKLAGQAHATMACRWMRASGGPGGQKWPRHESENGKRPGNGYILTN